MEEVWKITILALAAGIATPTVERWAVAIHRWAVRLARTTKRISV